MGRRLASLLLALPLHALLIALLGVLGVMSLGWNALALLLHPLLPPRTGLRLGRAAISRVYRTFWWLAARCGMLRINASSRLGWLATTISPRSPASPSSADASMRSMPQRAASHQNVR